MAFAPKIDRCGIIAATEVEGVSPFEIRDEKRGGKFPSDVYEAQLECGALEFEAYGEDATPSNTYALKGGSHTIEAGKIKLAAVTSVTETAESGPTPAEVKNYALTDLNINTKTGTPVAVDAAAKLVEDGTDVAARQAYWPLPQMKISTRQCPQDIFGCLTLTGAGCSFQDIKASAKVVVNPDRLVGKAISSDSNSGYISVTGTIVKNIKVADAADPQIAVPNDPVSLGGDLTSKWIIISAPKPTKDNPETAFPTFDFEVRLPLKKVWPAAQAQALQS